MPTVLEKGRKQVGELEVFLGGKPPAHAISQSKAALTDYARTHFAQRNAEQKRFGKLMAKSRERMLSSVRKDDPIIQRDLADAKEFLKERASRRIAKLKPEKVESQLVIGSQFTAKGLPLTLTGPSEAQRTPKRMPTKNTGTYELAVQSFGNKSLSVGAGLGVTFWSTEANPLKRFLVVLHYSYDWADSSAFYVAHNEYRTRLWMWGYTEQRWVGQSEISPSWSDGTGWLESHGNHIDHATDTFEMRFPALENSWYQGWIWSTASVYGDSGVGGYGFASIQAGASVPVMILGEL